MPYRGKPSKGCQICRRRKIRCDLRQGECENCIKARYQCPGYRNQLDLQFCDENERIIKKVQARSLAKETQQIVQVRRRSGFQDVVGIASTHSQTSTPGPRTPLFTSLEDVALAFFFHNHVTHSGRWPQAHASPLAVNKHDLNNGLLASIKALGMAGFSNETHRPELMVVARQHYADAIQSTNLALTSPTIAKDDVVLLSTIVLSYFEMSAGGSQRSVDAWKAHIHGSAGLLALRGPDQFLTWQGRFLYSQAIANIVTACLVLALPLPSKIHELSAVAAMFVPEQSDPVWQIHMASSMLADLRSEAANSISDPDSMIARAVRLDAVFVSVFSGAPAEWTYDLVTMPFRGDFVLTDRVHVYHGFFAAQMWNLMRSSRLLIHSIMLQAASRTVGYSSQVEASIIILHQMQQDILASIPQHLGLVTRDYTSPNGRDTEIIFSDRPCPSAFLWSRFDGPNNRYKSYLSKTLDSDMPQLPVMRMTGGYSFVWTLYAAGSMDSTTLEQRHGVIQTLELLSDSMGVRQAKAFAEMLRRSAAD